MRWNERAFPRAAACVLVHQEERNDVPNEPRDTCKYRFWYRGKVVHKGITNDLERREAEHQQRWPGGRIKQVGYRTTRSAARRWERDAGA